jgi:hypothetical protein
VEDTDGERTAVGRASADDRETGVPKVHLHPYVQRGAGNTVAGARASMTVSATQIGPRGQ